MNYWILTVTSQKSGSRVFAPVEIFQQRIEDGFWGLGNRTPNQKTLARGDRVLFYLGKPVKGFGGTATLASAAFELNEQEQERLSHGLEFYRAPFGVRFENTEVWAKPRSVEGLLPILDFIEDKSVWGRYLQGGVRHVTEKDYMTIATQTSKSNLSA